MWRSNADMYVTVPYNKVLFCILYSFNQPIGGCFWNIPHILYRTCTSYNCLPEDELSGSKQVHAEDIIKIKIKFSLKKVHFIGLHYMITLQSNVKNIKFAFIVYIYYQGTRGSHP